MEERRGKVRRYNTDPEYKKKVDEDKRARAKAEREADPPVTLFDRLPIIIPISPIGLPGAHSHQPISSSADLVLVPAQPSLQYMLARAAADQDSEELHI